MSSLRKIEDAINRIDPPPHPCEEWQFSLPYLDSQLEVIRNAQYEASAVIALLTVIEKSSGLQTAPRRDELDDIVDLD